MSESDSSDGRGGVGETGAPAGNRGNKPFIAGIRAEHVRAARAAIIKSQRETSRLERDQERATWLARDVQVRIIQRSAAIVEAVLAFHEVTPDQVEPPRSWVSEYGFEAACQRLEVAKAAWRSKGFSPIGIDIAARILQGYMRKEGDEEKTQAPLGVTITLPQPTSAHAPMEELPPQFPIKEIE